MIRSAGTRCGHAEIANLRWALVMCPAHFSVRHGRHLIRAHRGRGVPEQLCRHLSPPAAPALSQ